MSKHPEAAGPSELPPLPDGIAVIHDDGYWTSIWPENRDLQFNFGKKEVFGAKQMHAYAREHAAEVTRSLAAALYTGSPHPEFDRGFDKGYEAARAALSAEPGEKP